MPKFLALSTGSATATEKAMAAGRIDEAAGMAAWGEWVEANAARIVDVGGPLGKTKRIDPEGISDVSNNAAAYVIVEAADHQAAAEMFRNHAHFTHFPGDAVEIMPILDIPGN